MDQHLIRNDENKRLTTKENDLLKMLCQNMNKVTERDKALKKIWFGRQLLHSKKYGCVYYQAA